MEKGPTLEAGIEIHRRELWKRLRSIPLSDEQVALISKMAADGRLSSLGVEWVQFRSPGETPDQWKLEIAVQTETSMVASIEGSHGTENATKKERAPTRQEESVRETREYTWGVGRRKSAVARVRIAPGVGKFEINGRSLNEYFTSETHRKSLFGPLDATNTGGKFDVLVNSGGGGHSGQAGATVLGLARALASQNKSYEPALRAAGFMTRDSRMKERKKYGQRGARRKFQFSKR